MLLLSALVCAGVCVVLSDSSLQTATPCRCFPVPLERDWPRGRRRSQWPCAGESLAGDSLTLSPSIYLTQSCFSSLFSFLPYSLLITHFLSCDNVHEKQNTHTNTQTHGDDKIVMRMLHGKLGINSVIMCIRILCE